MRARSIVAFALAAALALVAAAFATEPLRSGANWMYFVQDDFFYYLKIAQNVAAGRGSTWNGLVSTNGYQPLWLWILAVVIRAGAGPRGILIFLAAAVWVSTMSTYVLSLRLLRRGGVEVLLSSAFAVYIAAYAARIFFHGMEVILTVPLMLGALVLVQNVPWWSETGIRGFCRSLMIGLLLSAMALSRLDCLIFAALLVLGMVSQQDVRKRIGNPQLAGIAAGLLPLLAYFFSNRVCFGVWIPVSGLAKELKIDHGFTASAWRSVASNPISLVTMLLVLSVLGFLPLVWKKLQPIERACALATLAFPFLYLATLSWMSDWWLMGWYSYPLRPALCFAFLVMLRQTRLRQMTESALVSALILAFIAWRMIALKWTPQDADVVDAANDLRLFAATHAGVYAMGDRSGAVGYLLPYPVVQTEGLVMDRQYLDSVARQVPLQELPRPLPCPLLYRLRHAALLRLLPRGRTGEGRPACAPHTSGIL